MKNVYILTWLLALFFLTNTAYAINTDIVSDFDDLRIEQEDKIFVPLDKVDEVWEYLYNRYIEDEEYLQSLDPLFTTYYSKEQFADIYFDTPDLKLIAAQSGVRLRERINLTNPEDPKSGSRLMQVKINSISDNEFERGELKFDVEYPKEIKTIDDQHPMIGAVQLNDRPLFKEQLQQLGLDVYSMRSILTVYDLRQRIYFEKDGAPFMSVSFDNVESGIWWAKAKFAEIEPELSEVEFTQASPEVKEYMEQRLRLVVDDLKTTFPYLETNLTPKYNKSFYDLESQIPFLRLLVALNIHNSQSLFAILVVVGFIVLGILCSLFKIFKKNFSKESYE